MFNKDRDGHLKNDLFADLLMQAFERGFNPALVCFDSWYGSIENLKLCRSLGWHFLTRLKANRQININRNGLQAVSEAELTGGDVTIVWLKSIGEIKVFWVRAMDGTSEYWAMSLNRMTESERENFGARRVADRDVSSGVKATMSDRTRSFAVYNHPASVANI